MIPPSYIKLKSYYPPVSREIVAKGLTFSKAIQQLERFPENSDPWTETGRSFKDQVVQELKRFQKIRIIIEKEQIISKIL